MLAVTIAWLAIVGAVPSALAQTAAKAPTPAAAATPASMDAILRQLALYDGGIESAAVWQLRDYVNARKDDAAGRAECEAKLLAFLNALHTDHLVLELAHRPKDDLDALKGIDKKIALGIGVIDIKVNHIETPDEVAARIEAVERKVGPGRVRWVHPDCGFWMLKRSIADRKIEALVRGRDLYLGR